MEWLVTESLAKSSNLLYCKEDWIYRVLSTFNEKEKVVDKVTVLVQELNYQITSSYWNRLFKLHILRLYLAGQAEFTVYRHRLIIFACRWAIIIKFAVGYFNTVDNELFRWRWYFHTVTPRLFQHNSGRAWASPEYMRNRKWCIFIYIFIYLYMILHSNDSMRMLRYHVLAVIGKGRHQCSWSSESQRGSGVPWDDNSVLLDNNRPESLIYLELEPWQWKLFTVGIY